MYRIKYEGNGTSMIKNTGFKKFYRNMTLYFLPSECRAIKTKA